MRPAHSRHPTTHSLQQQGFNNEYGPQKGLTKHDFPNQGYTQYHAPQPVFSNHNGQPEPTKRRKSLLIGINYQGQARPLKGCRQDVHNMKRFLESRRYPTDPRSMVILVDDRTGIFQPTKRNILAAMDWLVSEPDCQCFLHYSGHGGQVIDRQGDRKSGLDDTIVPVDYGNNGPIDSGTLHRALVSKLAHNSNLFVVFDCCHSGSALELPYVYRTDDNGNINLVNSVKEGITLMSAAQRLLQGGFSFSKITNAKHLFVRGKRFVTGLKYSGKRREEGLGEEHFQEDWKREGKDVVMFSGCRDDQTSADANIGGNHVGAMSWALLNTLNSGRNLSYVQVLQNTRRLMVQRGFKQVPQLSVGSKVDLKWTMKL